MLFFRIFLLVSSVLCISTATVDVDSGTSKKLKIGILAADWSERNLVTSHTVGELWAASGNTVHMFHIRALGYFPIQIPVFNNNARINLADVIAYNKSVADSYTGVIRTLRASSEASETVSLDALRALLDLRVSECVELLQSTSFIIDLEESNYDFLVVPANDDCLTGIAQFVSPKRVIKLGASDDNLDNFLTPGIGPRVLRELKSLANQEKIETTEKINSLLAKKFKQETDFGSNIESYTLSTWSDLTPILETSLSKTKNLIAHGLLPRSISKLSEFFTKRLVQFDTAVVINLGFEYKFHESVFLKIFEENPNILFIIRSLNGENFNLETGPRNVLAAPWFPQVELLQDTKTKVFITTGSLQSISEAVESAKSVIIIPQSESEFSNARLFEYDSEYPVVLPRHKINKKGIRQALTSALTPETRFRALRLRDAFRLSTFNASKSVVEWIEFVASL